MAKPKKDRDRRAVIEQMRRDQQRSERRRTMIVISLCVAVALVIVGAAAVPLIKQNRLVGGPLAELGDSAESAGCGQVIERKATGNQQHRPVGTPIKYQGSPPADGPHWPQPAPFARKIYTVNDRPQLEYLVHNLEHGYTILWYDDTVRQDDDQMAVIRAIAKKYDGQKLTDKFIAVPWTSKDGSTFPDGAHVALTHWSAGGKAGAGKVSAQRGVWQYCDSTSGQAVKSFMKKFPYSDSPEPQGA